MMSRTVVLACLLLAPGAALADAPGEFVYLNQRAIKLPLTFKDRSNIQALTLYVSTDQGQTWQQQANSTRDQESFTFYAPTDGVYWFAMDITDVQGKHSLGQMDQTTPAQKIVIDTLKPQIRIASAVRRGENIEVAWEIQEDHPNLSTLRLEYRTADAPADAWQAVAVEPRLVGRTSFPLRNRAAVFVRMQLADLAQNQAVSSPVEIPAADVTLTSLASGGSGNREGSQSGNGGGGHGIDEVISPGNPSGGHAIDPVGGNTGARHRDGPTFPTGEKQTVSGPGNEGVGRLVASTSYKGVPASVETTHEAPKKSLPPVQVVKTREVTLAYTLKDVGPSGVGMVELWLTRDDGQTWERYAEDPEVKAARGNARYQRTVQLPPEDGVYGIRMVVRSRAGLGKPPPKPGDPPQMRVEVDTVAPEAKLFEPRPVPGQRDALVLTWSASDRNLAANPITLQWTEQPGGTWHTIAAQLANTGKHVWKLPPNLPDRVYLRLVARDTAGNEGIAETREPQLVDLSEPEGVLLGVVTTPGTDKQ